MAKWHPIQPTAKPKSRLHSSFSRRRKWNKWAGIKLAGRMTPPFFNGCRELRHPIQPVLLCDYSGQKTTPLIDKPIFPLYYIHTFTGVNMSPINYMIIHKKIHPPEADALADSYARASRLALEENHELSRIILELDSNWDGSQKNRFQDSFRSVVEKSRQYAVGALPMFEKQFRAIQVDVEERVPITPQ